jgi:hypothetical protein
MFFGVNTAFGQNAEYEKIGQKKGVMLIVIVLLPFILFDGRRVG